MKKFIAWLLRICCFAIIGLAVYTIATCVMHMNDDHSKQAVLGAQSPPIQNTFQSAETPAPVELVDNSANENPTVVLSADGTATMNHSAVTVQQYRTQHSGKSEMVCQRPADRRER